MAEESLRLEEKRLTLETKAGTNSGHLSERSTSSSGRAENTFTGAGATAENHAMGSSNQPISGNANASGAEACDSLSGRTLSGSRKTKKVFGGAGANAGHENTANRPLSSHANNGGKISSNSSPDRTISGPGSTYKNVVGTSAGARHQNMAGSTQLFSREASMLTAATSPANMDDSCPSSLRSNSTCTSYSLEISLSTASNETESPPLPLQTPPESRNDRNEQIIPSIQSEETKLAASHSAPVSKPLQRNEPVESAAAKVTECTDMLGNCQIVTSKDAESRMENTFSSMTSSYAKLGAQPISKLASQTPKYASMQSTEQMESLSDEKRSAENEEEMFYAFVILHAPEDAEEAARLKARLERTSSTTGATFAEDFAEPGRSTFRCVEDAINNSAYIMLLLTPNFNTHLNELSTDSALMNSIEKPHKYNTVIPLLPRDNSLTSAELPIVLRTKIAMKEKDKAFEIMARKVLDPEKIRRQKKIWKEDLRIRKQREMQQELQDENRRHKDFIRESKKVRELEQERMRLLMQQQYLAHPYAPQSYQPFSGGAQPFGTVPPQQWQHPGPPHYSGTGWHQSPPSNIHIQNAKYIMIGNESNMHVGGAGISSGEEDC
ncbi:hypothetical protein NFI96_004790 [Prochilodus magdalenae]|nr:hypothetical protein NFI96_004790 [Prochilodus magdalenae]